MENKEHSHTQAAKTDLPEILAPAGDKLCFLAALAAGANGIYLGLKNFSARMAAENFGLGELTRLVALAAANNCRVYVAMNNLLKENELNQAYRLVKRLATDAHPAGLIVQDLAMLNIARQAGFSGMIALSTLANVSSPSGLDQARALGADRVILPRELSLDEMRAMGDACPEGLGLECFVHGALCYCVSGRCYWSSYMGGKSGLRGRCVQPCRRLYSKTAKGKASNKSYGERLFSCQDLELLPVARSLLTVPNLVSWKIEGRKKGPHYVYHAVLAYRMLLNNPDDSQNRKMAQDILKLALGRPGVRARFLPQKKNQPMAPYAQTSSGLLAGKINIKQDGSCYLRPHFELLPKDYLRIGTEDEKWHATLPVSRHAPKGGELPLKLAKHKTPRAGTPVYLIDRREPGLEKILKIWSEKLSQIPEAHVQPVDSSLNMPRPAPHQQLANMLVTAIAQGKPPIASPVLGKQVLRGLWLTSRTAEISPTLYKRSCFWLPPAIWPENDQNYINLAARLWKGGARQFVCNAPWQRALFPHELPKDAWLIAGPFCNAANALALAELADMGFKGAFVSPELSGEDMLGLPKVSPLPLGIVIGGFWPSGVSRFGLIGVDAKEPFFTPRGEGFWAVDRAGLTWIFPAWSLDLSAKKQELLGAGYSFFAWLDEREPGSLVKAQRPGFFNWDGALL